MWNLFHRDISFKLPRTSQYLPQSRLIFNETNKKCLRTMPEYFDSFIPSYDQRFVIVWGRTTLSCSGTTNLEKTFISLLQSITHFCSIHMQFLFANQQETRNQNQYQILILITRQLSLEILYVACSCELIKRFKVACPLTKLITHARFVNWGFQVSLSPLI